MKGIPMEEKAVLMADVFKILSDPNRLVILDTLMDGEQCACKILEKLHITQPTLSHHMKILCGADLIFCRRDGKWIYYSLRSGGIREACSFLQKIARAPAGNHQHPDCCG